MSRHCTFLGVFAAIASTGPACPLKPADVDQAVYRLCAGASDDPEVVVRLYVLTGQSGYGGVNECAVELDDSHAGEAGLRLIARGTPDPVEARDLADNSKCWPTEYRCSGSECEQRYTSLLYDRDFARVELHKEGTTYLPVLGWQSDGLVFCEESDQPAGAAACCSTSCPYEDAGAPGVDSGISVDAR